MHMKNGVDMQNERQVERKLESKEAEILTGQNG